MSRAHGKRNLGNDMASSEVLIKGKERLGKVQGKLTALILLCKVLVQVRSKITRITKT